MFIDLAMTEPYYPLVTYSVTKSEDYQNSALLGVLTDAGFGDTITGSDYQHLLGSYG